jgi:glycosyltransferase involved in cell wall biosynthesis
VIPSTSEVLPKHLGVALAQQTITPIEVIHIYDKQRNGAAWARNRGIEKASGNIVACIDDDCIPPANWLASITEAMSRYNADVVGGTYEERDPFLRARRNRQRYPSGPCPDYSGIVGAGGNIAYQMDILMQARARDGFIFNESFRISQDWELIWRLRDLGAKVYYQATPVQHLKSLSSVAYLQQQFFRGVGIAWLNEVRKGLGTDLVVHRSLLWSDSDSAPWKTLLKLVWHKGIGPFDIHSFDSFRQFALFWSGEKVQSVGFLWAKWRKPAYRLRQPVSQT